MYDKYPVKSLGEVADMDSNFEPLPIGTYECKLTNITNETASSGNEGIKFEFTIQQGDFKKRKLWETKWMFGKTEEKTKSMLGMFKGFLKSLGMSKDQRDIIGLPPDIGQIWSFMEGARVMVEVGKRTADNGKEYDEVLGVESLSDVPF